MRKKFWDKRIPSLLGLLFLAMSVGMVSWFGKNYTQLRSKASVGETPDNVQISNITDTSFTISYTTAERVTGIINYGRDLKLGQVGLDDRDREAAKSSSRQLHYITISQLDPGTKYYFTILSGAMEFRNNNQPYNVTTATKPLESTSLPATVTGSVNLPDGTIPIDGIVYLSTSTSQLLSALLKIDGTYLLPVSSLRTSDLTGNVILGSDTILQMTIRNADSQSHVSVKAAHANPIPLVTLSKDYDFIIDTSLASLTASESGVASPSGVLSPAPAFGFPSFSDKAPSVPEILVPKEAEKFTDQQPLFRGTTAFANATVVVNIDTTQGLQNNIKADNLSKWQFRPGTPLSPGQHSISIQTLDASGTKQTVKRSFTILASGSQFTEPSVSPTGPTPTVSTSPIPSPTIPSPTTAPTLAILPTATSAPSPTLAPSFIPTPTLQSTITPILTISPTSGPTSRPTSRPITPPGSSSLLIGGLFIALSLSAGFMLFFLL